MLSTVRATLSPAMSPHSITIGSFTWRCGGVARFAWHRLCLLLAVFCATDPAYSPAGEITLKNGTVLTGQIAQVENINQLAGQAGPIKSTLVVMVTGELQRYFVPFRNIDNQNLNVVDLGQIETFKQWQPLNGGGKYVKQASGLGKPTRFDQFGRRTIPVRTANGEVQLTQGIVFLSPEAARLEGLNYEWKTAIAPSSIPADELLPILRQMVAGGKTTEPLTLVQRLTIVRYLIQANLYAAADAELRTVKEEFPDSQQLVDQLSAALQEATVQELVIELQRRRAAGQHQLSLSLAEKLVEMPASAAVIRDARDILDAYRNDISLGNEIVSLLAKLEAELPDELASGVGPLRAQVAESLSFHNIRRLDAFMQSTADATATAEEKLALALSGWILGNNFAVRDLPQTLQLWKIRFEIQQYLRSNDRNQRQNIFNTMSKMEGFSVERVRQMMPLLSPILDPLGAQPGVPKTIEVAESPGHAAVRYHVTLPWEYSPDHNYPLLVCLHDSGRDPLHEMKFWAGSPDAPTTQQSQRNGYIVIAPEYVANGVREYTSNSPSHQAVLEAVRDASLRYSVAADRIFISGHGMGGDATIDIAASNPDVFAGAMPFSGQFQLASKLVRDNANLLSWYFLSGDFDVPTIENASPQQMMMLREGADLIVCEYRGSGRDSFYAEIHKLFAWMNRIARPDVLPEFEFKSVRPENNLCSWLELGGIPEANLKPGKGIPRSSYKVSGRLVANTNYVVISAGGKARPTLWIPYSPDFLDLERKLIVEVNGKSKFSDFVKPDPQAVLEGVRRRGDRKRLFVAVIDKL